jgi:hypothetical protein
MSEDQKDGLTDKQREERDPAALQKELLEIDRQMNDLRPVYEAACEAYNIARTPFEVAKLKMKLLKDRRSCIQSVLKSVSIT